MLYTWLSSEHSGILDPDAIIDRSGYHRSIVLDVPEASLDRDPQVGLNDSVYDPSPAPQFVVIDVPTGVAHMFVRSPVCSLASS